jgi:hypothetical protein
LLCYNIYNFSHSEETGVEEILDYHTAKLTEDLEQLTALGESEDADSRYPSQSFV